uniref:Zinc knuckle CX2CX4HX4C n=1 Tax=Tanacetum cinerariifolium TaxID=118510 RepID=A0A6L2KF59_TANCI|nr:hypothetical protein [Tanacetum cinerariifolium]
MFQDFCYSDTVRPFGSDEVLKLKNFKKDESISFQARASRAPHVEYPIVNEVVSSVNDGSSNSVGPNGSYVSSSDNVVELNTGNDDLELKAGNDGVPGSITSIDDTQGLQDNEAGVDVGIADVAQADEHAEVYSVTCHMQVPMEYPTGPVPNQVEGFSFMKFGNVCVSSSTAQKNYTNTSQNGPNDFVNGSFTVGTSQLHNGDTVATIFGVPLKSLKDIDDLTRRMKAGESEVVMLAMTNDERKAVMDEIVALWEKLLANESPFISSSPNEELMENLGGGNASAKEPHIVNWHLSILSRSSGVKADEVLKESITMGILLLDGLGFYKETVRVEYEWKLPRCEQCKIIDHVHDQCHKTITIGGKSVKPNVKYVSKAVVGVPKTGASNVVTTSKSGPPHASTTRKNKPPKASVLPVSLSGSTDGKNGGNSNIVVPNPYDVLDEESKEEVENVFRESVNLLSSVQKQGQVLSTRFLLFVARVNSMYGMS